MDLHILRQDLKSALETSGLSQFEFASQYGVSYSSLNKFLNKKLDNPRLSSLNEWQAAIDRLKRKKPQLRAS